MKLNFLNTAMVFVSAIALVGCGGDSDDSLTENHEPQNVSILNLRDVDFPVVSDSVLSGAPTGKTEGKQRELQLVVRKQFTLSPVELIDERNSEVIFPGSVLRGDAFLKGEYSPVVIKNPQNITLSITLQGTWTHDRVTTLPQLSAVRQTINNWVSKNATGIDYDKTPSYLTYQSSEVSTAQSFNKVFQTHEKSEVIEGLVKNTFDFEETTNPMNSKKAVLVKVRQLLYNVSVEPKSSDEWGELVNVGEYEPLYVSSVDYGRVVHLLIETDLSADSVSKIIKGCVDFDYTKVGSSENFSKNIKTFSKFFSENNVKVLVAGGFAFASGIHNYDNFIKFLDVNNADEYAETSVPIGYTVQSVKSTRRIQVRSFYTEERFVWE